MVPWGGLLNTGGAIFCYHSLTTPALPSASTVNVPLDTFRSNLHSIRRLATVVSLRDLLSRHRAGKSIRGLAALTFDDSYVAVRDLLQQQIMSEQIPITFFVASAFTEGGSAYWWDRVDDLYPRVPESIWREFERTIGLPETFRRGHGASSALRPLRQWILAEFAGRLPIHVEEALTTLEDSVGTRTCHRAMTWAELMLLAQIPSVDLGVHTRTHPVLPLLSDVDQLNEIGTCYQALLERIPRAVPVLAIPFGLYDGRTGPVARAAGMEAALTLGEGLVPARRNPEGLVPRITANTGLRGWRVPVRVLGWLDPVIRRRRGLAGDYPELPSPTS